jgi:hypothetical protein
MSLDYTYRSLEGTFPRKLTADIDRKPSPFGKPWEAILNALERELLHLEYRYGSCVIQTAHTPWDVRGNGQLRRDARRPEHPGVVVRFDVFDPEKKRYVPMQFECDQFWTYEANIRAIADAMEALRKVNRYGVTGAGHGRAQYEGYKALPSAEGKTTTVEDAAAYMATYSGLNRNDILTNPTTRAEAYRRAAIKLHPDQPEGSHEKFVELQKSLKVLSVNAPVGEGVRA